VNDESQVVDGSCFDGLGHEEVMGCISISANLYEMGCVQLTLKSDAAICDRVWRFNCPELDEHTNVGQSPRLRNSK
jgi:hypothetical protein